MAPVIPLYFVPPQKGRLAPVGEWMARHRGVILTIQWSVISFYFVLIVLPAFLPYPKSSAHLFGRGSPWHDRLALLAQYLFWGVWWPFVILSTMAFGRLWCGLLCPEGALSEFAAKRGHGRVSGAIPRWMRWSGWSAVAFVLTTVYGQLTSVYEYPQAALLVLGSSTLAAVIVGYIYGRGKRVWCRYLCPVSGVFALLARLSPFHFSVDRARWDAYPLRPAAVDCAPLINIKHMTGASQCHACGRCAGHRDAVALAIRSPNMEILHGPSPSTSEALLLTFGILGLALGAFQWSVNPWFVHTRQLVAEWLIERDILWPLNTDAPWWLLTHHEQAGDMFSWLDGAMILGYMALNALVIGGFCWLAVWVSARVTRLDWRRMALALTPLAGFSLFLGLSMMTTNHLRAEGLGLAWLGAMRAVLLGAAALWSGMLGMQLVATAHGGFARCALAWVIFMSAITLITGIWMLVFW